MEKVDLSLDDIIKMNRKKKPTDQKGKKQQTNPTRLRNLGTRSGIIRKGGPKRTSIQPQQQQSQQSPNKKEPTMLHVSNLHYNVSNDDVRELFAEVGPIKKAAVHYDKSGRSLGTADVTFATRDAAIRAIKKYNNLPLDGRPMSISLVPGQTRNTAKDRIGIKSVGIFKKERPQIKPTRGGPPRGKNNVARGGKPNTQRQNKKPVTVEDLDADLERYTMDVGTD